MTRRHACRSGARATRDVPAEDDYADTVVVRRVRFPPTERVGAESARASSSPQSPASGVSSIDAGVAVDAWVRMYAVGRDEIIKVGSITPSVT